MYIKVSQLTYMYLHMYLFRLFPTVDYYKILNVVPDTFGTLSTFLFRVHMAIFHQTRPQCLLSVFFKDRKGGPGLP